MTLILIHDADRLVARLRIDPETLQIDDRDPDFPCAQGFAGEVDGLPGARFSHETFLGSFLDGPARQAASAPSGTEIALSCGPTRRFALRPLDPDQGIHSPLVFDHDGVRRLADETPIGVLLDEAQRHFLTRVPRIRPE